jgi:hypothetical protein
MAVCSLGRMAGVIMIPLGMVAAGCLERSPNYCPGWRNNNCLNDPPGTCRSDQDCTGDQAVCDVAGTMMCVQCTADKAGACTGATPVCGADHVCRGCSAHAECAGSDVCLPGGRCAAANEVAYVQAGGTGAQPCARGAPCGRLQEGVTAVNASRPYIKVMGTGTLADTMTTTIDGKAVTILADPGAKLDRTGDGVILEVRNTGADVRIYDLEITGASGGAGDVGISIAAGGTPRLTLTRVKITNNIGGGVISSGGIVTVAQSTVSGNQGGGITASGGTLTVGQSTVSGNQGGGITATGGTLTVGQSTVSGNQGGGITATGGTTFDITNCFIFRNGNSTTATVGGASLAGTGGSVFEFNTIVDNQIGNSGVLAGGVFCDTAGFVAGNNIIARNFVNNDANLVNSNTSGLCTYPTSAISPSVSGLNFVSPDNAPHNYRIMRGSIAIDQATTPSTLSVDVDGDPRPQGAARDQGADEVL